MRRSTLTGIVNSRYGSAERKPLRHAEGRYAFNRRVVTGRTILCLAFLGVLPGCDNDVGGPLDSRHQNPADPPPLPADFTQAAGLSSLPLTPTGFYYPTGDSDPGPYAGFVAQGCWNPYSYTAGYYHLGHDIRADEGSAVYAISDGVIVRASSGGWGSGNYALIIRHRLANDTEFLAVYGHIHPWVWEGSVTGGQVIGTIGPYGNISHLHFGIRTDPNNPWSPLGRTACSNWQDQFGFVSPLAWIQTQSPDSGRNLDSQAMSDLINFAAADARFGQSSFSIGADPYWDPNWELRWMDFNFRGFSLEIGRAHV